MKMKKSNHYGFSAIIVVIALAVIGIAAVVLQRVINNSNGVARQSTDTQTDTSQITPLSTEDLTLLDEAKKLKRIDFDLDGVRNTQDADDDNDGIDDDNDNDDDNDGVDDDDDADDDNDGTEDNDDTEASEESEASELEAPDQD